MTGRHATSAGWRSPIGKTVRSIKRKGVARTMPIVLGALADLTFDLRYGTDTRMYVSLGALDVRSENKSRGRDYQSTEERPFRRLMRALNPPRDAVFVDFGCGKGRVLLLAARSGFTTVRGVEFSGELCEIARNNVAAYACKVGCRPDIDVIKSDAAEYEIRDDERIFYFFNPFDDVVMAGVLSNIRRSHERRPRPLWLIYHNPLLGDGVVRDAGLFGSVQHYRFGRYGFSVYVTESSGAPPS